MGFEDLQQSLSGRSRTSILVRTALFWCMVQVLINVGTIGHVDHGKVDLSPQAIPGYAAGTDVFVHRQL